MFMRHPQSGPIRRVSERAFETIWKDKGWEAVDEQEATTAAVQAAADLTPGADAPPLATGPGTNYDALTIGQLEHAATVRPDVDLAGATRKSDIVKRFVSADKTAVDAQEYAESIAGDAHPGAE